MTTIVAVHDQDLRLVMIGGDRCLSTAGNMQEDLGEPKIWGWGDWLCGQSGSIGGGRIQQDVQDHGVDAPSSPSVLRKRVNDLLDSYSGTEAQELLKSIWLFAHPQFGIFTFEQRVLTKMGNYYAIGSGRESALAALCVFHDIQRQPLDLIQIGFALEVAEKFTVGTRRPFDFLTRVQP